MPSTLLSPQAKGSLASKLTDIASNDGLKNENQ